MQLEKASSATLIAWILVATGCVALYVTMIFSSRAGIGLLPVGAVLVAPLAMLVTAWQIDDVDGPILSVDERGMTVCPVFSTGAPIPWADIEDVRIVSWYYNFFFRVPFMSWLVVNLRDSGHIGGLQWFLPPAWFGRIAIPTRFVKGGTKAARTIIRASQGGLLEGEVARERNLAGTDAMLARGDAAIQRALAARGGAAPGPQLSVATERSHEPRAGTPQPSLPIPRGYGAEPETAPPMTIPQPAPIMVNGVPYQPQRVGGFGRKRG